MAYFPLVMAPISKCNVLEGLIPKEKLRSRFARKTEILLVILNMQSNQRFQKPNIILWSLRSFGVERFHLNQSLKIDFGRKSFLYQCKNSAGNLFFPKIEIRSNDLSQIEATPLLTPPACSIQLIFPFLYNIEKSLKLHNKNVYFPLGVA